MVVHESRGATIVNVLVVIVCLLIVVAISRTLLDQRARWLRQTKDTYWLRGIHQTFAVMAHDFNGAYPTPGLMGQLNDVEDVSQNTTANLFSLCIMQNYMSPEQCVSPVEPSAHVHVMGGGSAGEEYDWSAYSPVNYAFWDVNFKADLHDVSHVSYAHLPLFGELKAKHWRATLGENSGMTLLGNRGPVGGGPDAKSITNRIHAPHDRWSGLIVDGSGAVKFTETFPTRPHASWFVLAAESLPAHGPPATDAAITFTKSISPDQLVAQHD